MIPLIRWLRFLIDVFGEPVSTDADEYQSSPSKTEAAALIHFW